MNFGLLRKYFQTDWMVPIFLICLLRQTVPGPTGAASSQSGGSHRTSNDTCVSDISGFSLSSSGTDRQCLEEVRIPLRRRASVQQVIQTVEVSVHFSLE